jgi:membrane-bound inhibitor of C-type lysozyme
MIDKMKRAVLLLAMFAAGCSAPKPAGLSADYAYVCEDGRAVRAIYAEDGVVRLTLEGTTHTLGQAVSASGARYVGEGLQWWNKGDAGRLSRLASGEESAEDPGVVCTPPSRAPGSARGAAKVVDEYYALVESGKLEAARRLRTDGALEDVAPFATLVAEVGAPGAVEGAAGSIYVRVPVVLYGRYVTGGAYRRAGQVTLRRVNDVPGVTADQRRWRIVRIELTP